MEKSRAQCSNASREFSIYPPIDDGALRNVNLENMLVLCSRPLVLWQCPPESSSDGWPDLGRDGPACFDLMTGASRARYSFLCKCDLPRTAKSYRAIPIPIRALINNCYFRGALYLLGCRTLWYHISEAYYKCHLDIVRDDGSNERKLDPRYYERQICTFMRYWEICWVQKTNRLSESMCRLGTTDLQIIDVPILTPDH